MPSINSISADKLIRLIGTPKCPAIIDVRIDDDFAADQRLIPGSQRKSHTDVSQWAQQFAGCSTIIVCQKGLKLSHGVAALLREAGITAEILEGGFLAWGEGRLPLVPINKLPPRDSKGRTRWVTRERPKIDRVACPWLIRRFVDPNALFMFVSASEVTAVAERFDATPFDVEGVFWSHRAEFCTFDLMVEEFGLSTPPLMHLAAIIRGADTGKPDLTPESAGLLAASLGLSRIYADDLAQLDAGMLLYDAFYRWARDATGETHTWHSAKSVV